MKSTINSEARKHPVNLSLNEDLVAQVRSLTNSLSGVVETLLAESSISNALPKPESSTPPFRRGMNSMPSMDPSPMNIHRFDPAPRCWANTLNP